MKNLRKIETSTGAIMHNNEVEFLYVADYSAINNIKADFLGYTKELKLPLKGIKAFPLEDKIVITISTQFGCIQKCVFCDAPKIPFRGNVPLNILTEQLKTALVESGVKSTKRLNLHYARMGEPTWNKHVLTHARSLQSTIVDLGITADVIHPVISTMMPKANKKLVPFLHEWCEIKNEVFNGDAGLQLSITTSDEEVRKRICPESLSLEEISSIAKKLPKPKGRKYTLNFPLGGWPVDGEVLRKLFDPEHWICKITPIHNSVSVSEDDSISVTGYDDYAPYTKVEESLKKAGFDVLVFIPSIEEEQDRITCGNLLLSDKNNTI